MTIFSNYQYTQSHEWLHQEEDNTLKIGITDHAQDALGDIVHLELPAVGEKIKAGQSFAVIESVKAASDIYAPISGEVIEINESLKEHPQNINTEPYEYWLVKIKPSADANFENLLSAEAYEKIINQHN